MARKRLTPARSGRSVLIVDDNPEYLEAARRVVQRDGHEVIAADSGAAGLEILRARDVDLVLVDFLMPSMTGDAFVRALREFRPSTQVILQTGYASEHPPRELLRSLDIQGFHDKSDGPDKLALWVDVGLKTAFTVQLLTKSRLGLRYILDATPSLHRIQPLSDLLQGILLQTAGLLGATDSFVASIRPHDAHADDGFLAMAQEEGELRVRAATGRFAIDARVDESLEPARLAPVLRALSGGGVVTIDGSTIAPLRVAGRVLGVVYLDEPIRDPHDTELVEVFANQAAVAIHNVALYEMAALDGLSGVATRRFFEQSVQRELRGASRSGSPLGLLVIDVDQMKHLNDRWGHLVGDRALAAIGATLRAIVRSTDIAGRIGGDEFAVLLPSTDESGVRLVMDRMRDALAQVVLRHETRVVPVAASVGGAVLTAATVPGEVLRRDAPACFERTARALFEQADRSMYEHKRLGHAASAPAHADWVLRSQSASAA